MKTKTLFIVPPDTHYYEIIEMLVPLSTVNRTPAQQADMPP
jgi:hypothetical protein